MLKRFHSCFVMGLSLAALEPASEPGGQEKPTETEVRPEAVAGWRRELKKHLDQAERRVMSQWGPEAAFSARRMVTIWLDELLLTAPWPGRKLWQGQPLQKDWAEGRSGGQWFFEELQDLVPDRRDNRELAALALRCLTLGLTGRYGRSPEESPDHPFKGWFVRAPYKGAYCLQRLKAYSGFASRLQLLP